MSESPALRIPGSFEYIKLLGRGSFGVVCLARQRELDRLVALKILTGDPLTHEEEFRRFQSEARLTASIHHPGIVVLLDFGLEEGCPWIAYEYLSGGSLADRLEAGPLTVLESVSLVTQVASALQAAHDQGIVHRDIKPTNVMVAGADRYKLIDFGIARWTTDRARLTQPGLLVGTPGYMAPEQIRGEEAGPAADIYALGVLLYRLVSGRQPFLEADAKSILLAHLKTVPPLPSSVNPVLPASLDEAVMRALEKEPDRRYRNASDLGHTLNRCLADLGASSGQAIPVPVGSSASRQLRERTVVSSQSTLPGAGPASRRTASPTRSAQVGNAVGGSRHRSLPVVAGGVSLLLAAALLGVAVTREPASSRSESPASPLASWSSSPAAAATAGPPSTWKEFLGPRKITLDLVLIPGGTFTMGSPDSDPDREAEEGPPHSVRVPHFYLGRTEITEAQFAALMGGESHASRRNRPVQMQNVERAEEFCRKLAGLTGRPYRLPSEAEWEFACRGGGTGRFGALEDEKLLKDHAWYDQSHVDDPQPVAGKPANPFGLHDMLGNVKEWVGDRWHPTYAGAPDDGRAWSEGTSSTRIVRGGAYLSSLDHCRCSARDPVSGLTVPTPGFRVALPATAVSAAPGE